MRKILYGRKISVFVNNFGMIKEGKFEEFEAKEISELIYANITALTLMTKVVILNMLTKDTKCAFINVGSEIATYDRANMLPASRFEIYRACKSY
jgi:short-subunit dehydrogenase